MNLKYFGTIFAAALIAFLAACSSANPQQTARQVENKAASTNQQTLINSVPIPTLKTSLERQNLVERAKFLNNTAFVSCVYLYAENGSLVAFFPVKYKISSLNSYLLPGDQIIHDRGELGGGNVVIESPDIDGGYGKNDDGIFFFTADTNEYVEWKGSYLYTSGCSKATSSTLLVQETAAE